MKLSYFLKEKRQSYNLSLREAANRIGISHGYLNKLELGFDERSGKANKPTPDVLKLIATAYKVDYDYLMNLCGYTYATKNANLPQDHKQLIDYYEQCDEIDKVRILAYAEAVAENNKEVYKNVDK